MSVGDCQRCATLSVKEIFESVPKTRQMDLLGEYNEASLAIEKHVEGLCECCEDLEEEGEQDEG